MKSPFPLLLAIFVLAMLVGVNAYLVAHPVNQSPIPVAGRTIGASATTDPGAAASRTDERDVAVFDHAITRPLFSKDRRPYEPREPEPTIEEPAMPIETGERIGRPIVKLLGISLTGRSASALVRGRSGGLRWIQSGELIGGWAVSAIDAGAITLSHAGERFSVALYPQDHRRQ